MIALADQIPHRVLPLVASAAEYASRPLVELVETR